MRFSGFASRIRHRSPIPATLVWLCVVLSALLSFAACSLREGPAPPPAAIQAGPDPFFNQLFQRSGNGWTGGDGTLSIGLPDGRTLWLFGDTFLGHVRPDGTRSTDSPLIRNSLVAQEGTILTTLHGGTTDRPVAFLVPATAGAWYWPGDGLVSEELLQVFYHRFRQDRPGMWGWAWDGTVIAEIDLPALTLVRVVAVPDDHGIAYGAALLEADGWVYIFGTEQRGAIKHLHVARAAPGELNHAWSFWSGRNWSADPGASRAVLAGVSSQFGVVDTGNGIGLVTMDERQPFSDRLVVYFSDTPTGPWSGPVEIYRAPEADSDVAAYNPFVHSQFKNREGDLVSYNINHVHDPDTLYDDVSLYRPRFIRVDLKALALQSKDPLRRSDR